MQPTGTQRIVKIRRDYNSWVADETMEDYALRFTPKSFRKWSELRIANTALSAVSFLALEAIGGALALSYGFTNTLAKANASTGPMREAIRTLAKHMSPMTPHLAEAVWAAQGGDGLCTTAPNPRVGCVIAHGERVANLILVRDRLVRIGWPVQRGHGMPPSGAMPCCAAVGWMPPSTNSGLPTNLILRMRWCCGPSR